MKKILTLILTAVMLFTLIGSAAAMPSAFPDITDDALARDVAVLQMLGVIGGDQNGYFVPSGTLTRAQFCKMAVMAMGKGDQAALYQSRTIFPDVRAGHWARGYINYAVSGDVKLILGNSDGTFRPEDPVTVAQAVTILVRMLGYTDADAGMLWPDGYLALAADKGLTDGVGLSAPAAPMARADAARLFVNLLNTNKKDGGLFVSSIGTTVSNAVVMELDVTAADGTAGAVRTSSGVYKTANGILPACIVGFRGTLVMNSAGALLTVVPDRGRQTTITAQTVNAAWIKDQSGARYDIPADTPAYTAQKVTTYGAVFIDIAPGMSVTLYTNDDGTVGGVFINTSKADSAYVVGADDMSGSFAALTGGDTGYKIYRNGVQAASSDLRQYDVLTYDKSAGILYASDFRISAFYEGCWPNMENPSKITLLGKEFPVLPSARAGLSKYKIGQVVTFLFTSDLQIAGADTGVTATPTAIGVVQQGVTTSTATVKFLNGLTVSGNPRLSSETAAKMGGELVSVSSGEAGTISIVRLNSSSAAGELDLEKMTLGTHPLSAAVNVFERAGKGPLTQIVLGELAQKKIGAAKVLYVGTDSAGYVTTLILDDVTGDRYEYGILMKSEEVIKRTESYENEEGKVITIVHETFATVLSLKNRENPDGTTKVAANDYFPDNEPGGVIINSEDLTAEKIASLTEAAGVKRSSFYTRDDTVYLMIDGVEYPVSDDVQCYNSTVDTWFKTLDEARAFADTLTVYYDKSPGEGGKVRVVVAE